MFVIRACKNALETLQTFPVAYCSTAICLQCLPMLAHFIEGREDMKDGARVGRSSTVKCAMFTVVVPNLWEGSCAQGLFLAH